jgi:hypothetical protein
MGEVKLKFLPRKSGPAVVNHGYGATGVRGHGVQNGNGNARGKVAMTIAGSLSPANFQQ